MTSLRRFAMLGLAVLVAASMAAQAQGGRPSDRPGRPGGTGRPGGPGGPPDPAMGLAGRVLHDIDLTDSQRRQIHELVRASIEGDLRSLIQDFGEARHTLETLVWDPSASDRDVAAAADTLAQKSLALERARRRLATQVLGALTPAQRQTFHEMLADARPPLPPGPPPREEPDSGP